MTPSCEAYSTIRMIRAASHCNVGFAGGSLTAGVGATDTSITSWRRLFMRWLYERFHPVYHCQPSEIMGGIGAMESYGAVFTLGRNITPFIPSLVFVEFCVNDAGAPDKDLVRKGLEGIIRQCKAVSTNPDVVFVGAGMRPAEGSATGSCDFSIHREVAAHYGCGFIDVQDFIVRTLAARGQTWDHVSISFAQNDRWHLNDYGNALWFEAVRDWFEEQWKRYDLNPTDDQHDRTLPEPIVSDELAHTALVDPSRRNRAITLEGGWAPRDAAILPWYLDNVLVGRPGDRLTYTFTGSAIGAICMVHPNGLKLEATLDGEAIPGPFTNFGIEFGKFFLMRHGLEDAEHTLTLEVAPPSRRQNRLPDPTAQIGYLAVAGRTV